MPVAFILLFVASQVAAAEDVNTDLFAAINNRLSLMEEVALYKVSNAIRLKRLLILVHAGGNGGATGGADTGRGKRMGVANAFRRQAAQVGGSDSVIPERGNDRAQVFRYQP